MTKFGLYNDIPKIPFESHLREIDESTKENLLQLREFVKSIADNIVEDIRPHRIVYSKTIAFRNFLDIKPSKNELIVSIRTNRSEPLKIHTIIQKVDLEKIKNEILTAYNNIN